jgi:hypothetical protein
MDEDANLKATPLAKAMAKYCISLDTALLFQPLMQQTIGDFVCEIAVNLHHLTT